MSDLEAQYAASIPPWCAYQTLAEHVDMMLCWSLAQHAERGEAKPESTCQGCELYKPKEGEGACL
jgi:hypothetical protein